MLNLEELLEEFSGFTVQHALDVVRPIHEGQGHTGEGCGLPVYCPRQAKCPKTKIRAPSARGPPFFINDCCGRRFHGGQVTRSHHQSS